MKKPFKERALKFWKKELRPFLIMAVAVFAVRSVVADWYDVPTGSMKPTIMEGDRVFVNKAAYDLRVPFTKWRIAQWGNPDRGDIVVCYSPADGIRLVKRVVAVPGDTIELRNNQLWVNGEAADYEALDASAYQDLPAGELKNHEFAEEDVAARKHSVMFTPSFKAYRSFAPVVVPDGQYFMMGDNRDNSFDSRYFGFIERRQIMGQALSVVTSYDKAQHGMRWHRFFTRLP